MVEIHGDGRTLPIQKVNLEFDLTRVITEMNQLILSVPFHSQTNQICLTHSAKTSGQLDKFYEGTGSLYDFEKDEFRRQPEEFTTWNSALSGTYFEYIYQRVQDYSSSPIGRVRLMRRAPRTCYSLHFDESPRLHLAITTNPGCYFVFPPDSALQIPADGHVYFFDATREHTALNSGNADRVHLVFDTI